MESKSAVFATWGCFVVAALALILSVIWRLHDKGGTLFSDGWRNGLSIFIPAVIIACAVLAAAIINHKAHSKAVQQSSGQGKPAWKKLQWCNDERERLEGEVRKLKDTNAAESARRQGFVNPKWEVVQGHNFVNTSIEIDGKAFRQCRFENVTFMFHGKAPTEFTSDNHFTGNKLRFDTDDPAVMAFLQLRMIVEKIPGATIVTGALDAKGNVMPENFRITVPSLATADTLHSDPRNEAEVLSDEIRKFVVSLGPRPDRKESSKQHSEAEELEAIREHGAVLFTWVQRLQAGWLGRFDERAQRIRHLLVERGITDVDLDMALRDCTADEKKMMRIADRLLILSRANLG